MQEKIIKAVLDMFPGLLYITDASGKIRFASQYTEDILGFDPVGMDLSERIECVDGRSQDEECLKRVWKYDDHFFLTAERPLPPGKLNGGAAVFGHEISEWTRMEEELLAAREYAESASAAKTRFLANMSHEIRTPLNAIMGMADIMLRTELDEKQGHYARTIKESSRLLLKIIKDILDFSKIEAGKVAVQSMDFDPREIVRLVSSTLHGQAAGKGLSMFVNIADDVPDLVRSDPDKLQQILVNLLGNAIKFTDTGFVSLTVFNDVGRLGIQGGCVSKEGGPPGCRVVFQVQDSGAGIPVNKLDSIFFSFTQVSDRANRRFGGTGLGLAICKNLVELLGGSISVSSTSGLGSKFTVVVPMEKVADMICPSIAGEEVESFFPSLAAISPENISILLVEDNLMNAEVSRLFLEQLGYTMEVAESGSTALVLLRENDFDLVLMDLELPDMSGNEVTARVRKGAAGDHVRNIPIVALTAHAFVEIREQCFASGVTDYLSKPVELETLQACLQRVLLKCSHPKAGQKQPGLETEEHLLDPEKKLARLGGDEEVLQRLYTFFLRDVPGQLIQLSHQVDQRNSSEVADLCHTLKGSAAIIGAGLARRKAAELEKAARLNNKHVFEELFVVMRLEFCQVQDTVRTYLDEVISNE